MAVAFDAKSTADTVSGTGVTTFTQTNLTIGASANALTYVAIFDANVSGITAHWDSTGTNQAMTVNFLWNATAAVGVAICTLLNPTTGAKTFSISWTTASQVTVCGVSWTGAGSFGTFTTNTGTATTATVTPTGAGANDQMIAVHGSGNGPTFSAPNGTSVFAENSTPTSYTGASNRLAGPSAALTYAMSTSSPFLSGGIAIIASAAAAVAFSPTLFFEPTRKRPPTEFMQGPFKFVSPALVSPWVQAPFFEPVRFKPKLAEGTLYGVGVSPALTQKQSFDLWFEPVKLKPKLAEGTGSVPGTVPPLASPYVQAPFFEPVRLKPKLAEGTIIIPGTVPALSDRRSFDPWFDAVRLKTIVVQNPDIVPPAPVAVSGLNFDRWFDPTTIKRILSEGTVIIPGTSPALSSPLSFDPWFDVVRLKQPIVQNPDNLSPPVVVVTAILSLAPWFDATRLKAVLTWQIDNVPPFTLEAPPPTTAFFDPAKLLRPRLWDMDLPPAFTLEAPPPTTLFFDPLRKLQVPAGLEWTKATVQPVTIVQGVLVDWFERVKLKPKLVETPLVLFFPAQFVAPPAKGDFPFIANLGTLMNR